MADTIIVNGGIMGPPGPRGYQGFQGIPGTSPSTASFATTGSNVFTGFQVISGSVTLTSGSNFIGNVLGTASFSATSSYFSGILPLTAPTLRYINTGSLDQMAVSFQVAVNPADTANSSGVKTLQSYYVPVIGIGSTNNNNQSVTSITFPDIEIGGELIISSLSSLASARLPLLTKLIYGGFAIASSPNLSNLSLPLLNYVKGFFSIATNMNSLPSASFSLLTNVGDYFNIDGSTSIRSINFPLLNYVYRDFNISNIATSSLIFPSLASIGRVSSNNFALMINNFGNLSGFNFNSLSSINGGMEIDQITSCTSSLSFPSLKSITGSLYIKNIASGLSEVSASLLDSVSNNFYIDTIGVTPLTLNFPSLQKIQSQFRLHGISNLQTASFNNLKQVGNVSIQDNVSSSNLNFPSLNNTTGDLWVYNNGNMKDIIFPSASVLYQVYIDSNNKIGNISLPKLSHTTGEGFYLTNIVSCSVIDISSLKYTTGQFKFENINNITALNAPLFVSSSNGGIMFDNVGLTTLSLPSASFTAQGPSLTVQNCTKLTTLNLPSFGNTYWPTENEESLRLYNLPALTSLTLSNSYNNYIKMDGVPLLTTFSSSASTLRIDIGTFYGQCGLANIHMPNVTDFYLLDHRESTPKPTLTSLSGPSVTKLYLRQTAGISPTPSPLTSVSFPNVTTVDRLSIRNTQITTLNLSTVINYSVDNEIYLTENASLTSLTLGTIGTLKTVPNNIDVSSCALNVASVNAILALLVSLDGTNGTIDWSGIDHSLNLSGGTNAAPTGQGITDRTTLNNRINGYVTTN